MERDDLDEDNERLQIILQDCEEGDSDEDLYMETELYEDEFVSNPSRPSTSSDFTASSLPTTSVCTDADDVMIRFDPSTVTSETCLAMNRAYQEVLLDTLRQVEMALFENRACQKQLEDSLQEKVSSSKNDWNVGPYCWLNANKILPYFKDPDTEEIPPLNPDVKMKEDMNEDKQHVKPKSAWSKQQRKTLLDAVKVDALEKVMRPALNKVELEMEKLQQCKSKEETKDCKARIEALKQDVKQQQNIPVDELLQNVDSDKIDFLKIAAIHFDGKMEASECESMWRNVLRPGINRDKWTEEENVQLNELVNKYQMRNWQQIVEELGTNRTPYQCLQHFQHINTVYDESPWREDEDLLLKEVIENFSFGSGKIPWYQVAYYIENRSDIQCKQRWRKINPERKSGRWTMEEDEMLINAVKRVGMVQDWIKIQELVPGRSAEQCRERYKKRLNDMNADNVWTYEEDKTILELHSQYGENWSQIADNMPRRTELSVQERFKRLMRWKEEMEQFNTYPKHSQKELLHTAFDIGEKGEIKIKDGLRPNMGANKAGRPIGIKNRYTKLDEGRRLREEAGLSSSGEDSDRDLGPEGVKDESENMEEIHVKKERLKNKMIDQNALELFVGYYNIDPYDYRKQQKDVEKGNLVVPRPVPTKKFKNRLPLVWKRRDALKDLVLTQIDQYITRVQEMTEEDKNNPKLDLDLYEDISKKLSLEGGCEEEKRNLIYSAFGGRNPGQLTVRELLHISRKLKEQGNFPRKKKKRGRPSKSVVQEVWESGGDSSDDDDDDDDNDDDDESSDDDGSEEDDLEDKETNRVKATVRSEKMTKAMEKRHASRVEHFQVNNELKRLIESKMDRTEFKHCGRRRKYYIYPKKILLKCHGMEEDRKLNKKSTALLMKALDVDGKKAYVKAHKMKRKLSALAMLKTTQRQEMKQAKTRHKKLELQETLKKQNNINSECMEVADYILDVHDELKINDNDLDQLDEEDDQLLESGQATTSTETPDGQINKTTRVEKTFPFLPPNQTNLRGMKGLLLEHRRLIDQAETYFNPLELRDQLYDLKRRGPNPFMGVINAAGKAEAAVRKFSRKNKCKNEKEPTVTLSAKECQKQLQAARQTHAYQQLKARFQSMFSWPALLATIHPPLSTRLPQCIRKLANKKTVQQLEHMLTSTSNNNGNDNVKIEAEEEEDEQLDPNLTEEEAIEKLVEKIMQEYEESRPRGYTKKKYAASVLKKRRTEILKKLGLFEKMQEYKRLRESKKTATATVTHADTHPSDDVIIVEHTDLQLPTISAPANTASTSQVAASETSADISVSDESLITPNKNERSAVEQSPPMKRGKGRPKGSKAKKIVIPENEQRKSQRAVVHTANYSEVKKGSNQQRTYKNIEKMIPKKLGKLVAHIDIPLLNKMNADNTEDVAANDNDNEKSSEKTMSNDNKNLENPEKNVQKTKNKRKARDVSPSKKANKAKKRRKLTGVNALSDKKKAEFYAKRGKRIKQTHKMTKQLEIEVRDQITQEILMEFEHTNNEVNDDSDGKETVSEMLTATKRQEIEGAKALVELAQNAANAKGDKTPLVQKNGCGSDRSGSSVNVQGRINSENDQGKSSNNSVVVNKQFHLEKVTTLKIPHSVQSNVTNNGASGSRGNALDNSQKPTGSVSGKGQTQNSIFIAVPVVVDGATQMACIPIVPDKDGKITLPNGNKIDAKVDAPSGKKVDAKVNGPDSNKVDAKNNDKQSAGKKVDAKITDKQAAGKKTNAKVNDKPSAGKKVDAKVNDKQSAGKKVDAKVNDKQSAGKKVDAKVNDKQSAGKKVDAKVNDKQSAGKKVDSKVNDNQSAGKKVDAKVSDKQAAGKKVDAKVNDVQSDGKKVDAKVNGKQSAGKKVDA